MHKGTQLFAYVVFIVVVLIGGGLPALAGDRGMAVLKVLDGDEVIVIDASDESAVESLHSFSYEFPGGLSLYSDRYEFSPPFTLTILRRFNLRPGEPPRTCTYQVPRCGEGDDVNVCEVQAVVFDPHVLALWPEEGEIVYGGEARHYDGGVFTITSPKKGYLTVGVLCRDDNTECLAEYQSLLNLRRVFADLAVEAQSAQGCENLKN